MITTFCSKQRIEMRVRSSYKSYFSKVLGKKTEIPLVEEFSLKTVVKMTNLPAFHKKRIFLECEMQSVTKRWCKNK